MANIVPIDWGGDEPQSQSAVVDDASLTIGTQVHLTNVITPIQFGSAGDGGAVGYAMGG